MNFIDSLNKILYNLNKHPERSNEISLLIKDLFNEEYKSFTCKKVFITKGNDSDMYIASVIPAFQSSNIFKTRNITTYNIDIDMSALQKGINPDEMTAWIMHDLFANIMTDETLLRFKKLIVSHYDTNNRSVMDSLSTYGRLLWIGVFSRTKKDYYVDDDSTEKSYVNMLLDQLNLGESWNSALAKYICNNDLTTSALSENYLIQKDKTQLREFNELARMYTSYRVQYNNGDYATFIKYIIATTKSELIKYYCEQKPDQIIAFKEKDVYNIFDDRRLLLENVDSDEIGLANKTVDAAVEINAEFNDLNLEFGAIESASDKINYCIRIKDFVNKLSKILESSNSIYDNDALSLLREKAMVLMNKANNLKIDDKLSIVELDSSMI